jgi:hypothetical protein
MQHFHDIGRCENNNLGGNGITRMSSRAREEPENNMRRHVARPNQLRRVILR